VLVLGLFEVAGNDPGSDLIASVAVEEAHQTEAYRFGPAGEHPGGNERIDLGDEVVVDPGHELRHGSSIAYRYARRNAPEGTTGAALDAMLDV
jgi:hypothetical protein